VVGLGRYIPRIQRIAGQVVDLNIVVARKLAAGPCSAAVPDRPGGASGAAAGTPGLR
jgi:hypothetical protein